MDGTWEFVIKASTEDVVREIRKQHHTITTQGLLIDRLNAEIERLNRDCPLHHPHSGPHPIPGVPHLYAHSRIETTGPNGGVIMKDLFWERKAGE